MAENIWSFEEFLCFVLIYASHADLDFSESEKGAINEKCDPKIYQRQLSFFNSLSDFQALNTIMGYKDLYFPTLEQKQSLLDRIKEQFLADGEFSPFEKEVYFFLDKML